jgi:hypothetical protein
MPLWRRVLALLTFITILGLRIEPQFLQLPFLDRKPLSAHLTARPDRLWPRFPRFLEAVRARTASGDSIALIAPTLDWNNGYSYAYYRASYFLAGREVLPLSMSDGSLHPENYHRATYVAVWGRELPPGHHTVVWRGEGGALLRR